MDPSRSIKALAGARLPPKAAISVRGQRQDARREPDVAGSPERLEESAVLKALLASQGSHGPLLAAIFLHCQNYLAVLGSSAGLT